MVLARRLAQAVTAVGSRRAWSLSELDALMDRAIAGVPTAAGESVHPDTALQMIAIYACVRLLADSVARLPFITYRRRDDGGKERAPEHRLYDLLHDQANPEMTAFKFRQTMMGHLLTWGNAYAEIEESDAGVKALWPLRPDVMTLTRNDRRELEYHYRTANGQTVIYPFRSIHHWPGFGFNGLVGHSPIWAAREAIGAAMATERYGAAYFGNGARAAGVLKHPGRLKPETAERIKARWEQMHQGARNAHRIAVLEEGLDYQSIGIPPEDSQFLETRKFHRAELASLYGVPPHMIGDVERSTSWGTGIEQQSIGFVTYTLGSILVDIEQRTTMDLFRITAGKRAHFAEFLVDGLLRGDARGRAEALAIQRQNGVITANEWRLIENRNPLPGGDVLLVNGNMLPADQAGASPPAPEPVMADMPELQPALQGGSNGRSDRH